MHELTLRSFLGNELDLKGWRIMKRIQQICLAVVLTGTLIALASAQNSATQTSSPQSTTTAQTSITPEPSLGNLARAVRKEKKPESAKCYDNDNLPRQDRLNIVGPGSDAADSSQADASDQASGADASKAGKASMPAVTPGETPEQRQQVYDQWKEKLSTQQSQIDLLSRELDVQQREYKLRAAEFYSDAGERLRNSAAWDKQDADYKQKLVQQQKALDDAKQKLNDMQEDARKSGVPSSVTESEQQ
jgi:hypothetical protein